MDRLEKKVRLLEAQLREARAQVTAATTAVEAEAADAVANFRTSASFKDELTGVALDSFHQGFWECRRKASKFYDLKGLDNIKPSVPFPGHEFDSDSDEGSDSSSDGNPGGPSSSHLVSPRRYGKNPSGS